ncbi:Kelch domain containing protein 1 [Dissostichus eleginoides]|uniref:Kelch domain containing protein 1 n=1 Tax=Dissostichus eleginoides TaxID=100907 RepID=A0AAD9BDM8_DISEL|nr:Kelch domain containing protein 1 [Dissostichus eleginoides]
MDAAAAERSAAESRLERCSHTAFIEDNTLYVWGGYKVVGGEDIVLPSDEIWLCDLYSGTWEMRDINGCDPVGYTNQMFSVDLTEQSCTWKKVTDTKGTTPSPRNKHSCWFHRDRLIYFGGYGCKTIGQATIGDVLFRCWGWNNEVSVYEPHTAMWSTPETRGPAPAPRGCHASALMGNKGYISGGVETLELDMFCLDLDTWTWTQFDFSPSCSPLGRSMFTMTPTSDHTLFIYGGLGIDGNTLNDVWQLNTQKKEWKKMTHQHKDKPRVCHSACLGRDSDVVVFGGSSNMCLLMDSVAVLRAPSQNQCRDVFMFQTQPCSLFRLCEDLIAENSEVFEEQLTWLPSKLRNKIDKRVAFFSSTKPVLTA